MDRDEGPFEHAQEISVQDSIWFELYGGDSLEGHIEKLREDGYLSSYIGRYLEECAETMACVGVGSHEQNAQANAQAFLLGGLIGVRVAHGELEGDVFSKLRLALYEPSFRLEQAVISGNEHDDKEGLKEGIRDEAISGIKGADSTYIDFADKLAKEFKTPFEQNNFKLGFGFIMHKILIAASEQEDDQERFSREVLNGGRDWDELFIRELPYEA